MLTLNLKPVFKARGKAVLLSYKLGISNVHSS
ncbi:MAG: hypothetical protein K0S32_3641 [Bacteroidetes bacterium]|jgi:hypothetical protein|nr:hypothetical protein [Bacteroidota bacterium]